MATRVTGTGPAEMKLLAARLKTADPALKRELRRRFRALGTPLAQDTRNAITSMPSHHDGTLRAEIAKTVTASTRITKTGIALDISSYGSRMPPGKGNLPAYTNSARGWNHPVYGRPEMEIFAHMAWGGHLLSHPQRPGDLRRRGPSTGHGRGWTWVKQTGKPGWFDVTIAGHAKDARRAAQAAMDDVKRKLGG